MFTTSTKVVRFSSSASSATINSVIFTTGVGVGVTLTVGVGVTLTVGVGVTLTVGVGVTLTVGVGVTFSSTVTFTVSKTSGLSGVWSLLTSWTERLCSPGVTFSQVWVRFAETT